MTGIVLNMRGAAILIGALALAGCDEDGNFAFPPPSDGAASAESAAPAGRMVQTERDVERPDVFEVTDRGLWDGRPSLGGIWVAHPDATDPERVRITNTENGRTVVGALFRRERENPGPLLQVSSDAADELGILAGAPTELSVVALRREEVEVEEAPEDNPVIASLAAPVTVDAAPLEPAEAEETPAADEADTVDVVLPPATAAAVATTATAETAEATAEAAVDTAGTAADTVDVSAIVAAPAEPLPPGTVAQIGIFSVEANAGAAAGQIIDAGIPANVLTQEIGGRTVWQVVAGPLADDGAIAQLKAMGFVDAFILEEDDAAE